MTKEEYLSKEHIYGLIQNGFHLNQDQLEVVDKWYEAFNSIDQLQKENEKLKKKNKKQKKILDLLKLINIKIGIDIVNDYPIHYFEPNYSYDNYHIVISKEQYETLKEWLEND